MTMKQTRINFDLAAVLAALGDLTEGPKAVVTIDESWGDGAGSRAVQVLYHDQRSLSGGANEDIDLKTDVDPNQVTLAMVELRVLIVACPSSNTDGIKMTPSSVDGWTTFLSSSGATDDPEITIFPGATMILVAPIDGSYAVAVSNDSLNFLNLDGALANVYTLTMLGNQS